MIDGCPGDEVLDCARREALFGALQREPTDSHRFVLHKLMQHIEEIKARICRFDARLPRAWRAA